MNLNTLQGKCPSCRDNSFRPRRVFALRETRRHQGTAPGSIIRRWITEPNLRKEEIERLAPNLLKKMGAKILPSRPDTIKRTIHFDRNRTTIDNYPLNNATLQEVADFLNKDNNKQVFISADGAFPLPQNLADRNINSILRNRPMNGLGQISINQLLNLRVQAVIQKLIVTFKVNPHQLFNRWEDGDPFSKNTGVNFRYTE